MSILIINTKAGRQGSEDQGKTKMVGQEEINSHNGLQQTHYSLAKASLEVE